MQVDRRRLKNALKSNFPGLAYEEFHNFFKSILWQILNVRRITTMKEMRLYPWLCGKRTLLIAHHI